MRIRENFDRFQGLENEITTPIHVPVRPPVEAAPAPAPVEDTYEAPRERGEVRAPRHERAERLDPAREDRAELVRAFRERRMMLAREGEDRFETLEALDWLDGDRRYFAAARAELNAELDGTIAAENELANEEGVARAAENPNYVDGQIDLSRIGTGLDPNQIPPQIIWDEEMVNHCSTDGQARGGVTQEQVDAHGRLAREVYTPAEGAAPPELNAGDLAVLVAETGVDLAKVDPNQLVAATRYLNDVSSAEERAERLRKTLTSFNVLTTIGAPPLDTKLMKEKLWQVARVPGHAFEKMSAAEVTRAYQEVAAGVNGGPGKSEIKIKDHTLKITVDANGKVTDSECKKPGFWSRLASIGRVVLSVASIIPSPIQPFAAMASGVIGAVRAARDGSILGMVGAAASALGAGFARFGAGMLDRAARVARGISSIARGVQSVQRGGLAGIIGGAAGIVGGVAGVAGDGMSNLATNMQQLATRLQPVGAIQNYHNASRAVGQAESALEAARASGNAEAIRAAERALELARRNQRSALYSGIGSVAAAAGTFAAPGSDLSRGLNMAGRGLDVARGINDRDFVSAAVGGLGFVNAARGPQEGFDWIQSASSVADAGNGYRLSLNNERDANRAVDAAEAALNAARRSGNPEAIAGAEQALRDARRNRGDAIAGTYYAQDDFANSLNAAVGEYQTAQREQRAREELEAQQLAAVEEEQLRREEGAASLKADADEAVAELEAVLENDRATGGFATIAEEAIATIERLKLELDLAVAGGDLDRIHQAADALEEARVDARSRSEMLRNVLGPVALPEPALATDLELPATAGYQIRPNDRLEIIARANAEHMTNTPNGNYTVRPNDTLSAIAAREGVSVDLLRSLNPQIGDDGMIYRDQQLNVPSREQVLVDYIDGRRVEIIVPESFLSMRNTQLRLLDSQNAAPNEAMPAELRDGGPMAQAHDYWRNRADAIVNGEGSSFGDGLAYLGNRFMQFSAGGAAAVERSAAQLSWDINRPITSHEDAQRRVDMISNDLGVLTFDSVLFGLSLYPPGRMLSTPLRGARAGVEVAEESAGLGRHGVNLLDDMGPRTSQLPGRGALDAADRARPFELDAASFGMRSGPREGGGWMIEPMQRSGRLPTPGHQGPMRPTWATDLDPNMAFTPRSTFFDGQLPASVRLDTSLVFRAHGSSAGGFANLTPENAARVIFGEVPRNATHVVLESCSQYGQNALRLEQTLNVARRGAGMAPLQVLVADRPGVLIRLGVGSQNVLVQRILPSEIAALERAGRTVYRSGGHSYVTARWVPAQQTVRPRAGARPTVSP